MNRAKLHVGCHPARSPLKEILSTELQTVTGRKDYSGTQYQCKAGAGRGRSSRAGPLWDKGSCPPLSLKCCLESLVLSHLNTEWKMCADWCGSHMVKHGKTLCSFVSSTWWATIAHSYPLERKGAMQLCLTLLTFFQKQCLGWLPQGFILLFCFYSLTKV